jgi:DNA polymerase I-like protein with 3'-5' exonuclease and polymerase domains
VREVEDQVIYPTCEMEKNGSPIDEELLEKWIKECQKRIEAELWKIYHATGLNVNPSSGKDMEKLFAKLNLPMSYTAKGAPSFTDEILKKIPNESVQAARKSNRYHSLKSKFLDKYKRCRDSRGILRYALHQLRAEREEGAYESGTVTGRYSSTELTEGVGCNIQQVIKVAKQRVSFGFDEEDESHDHEIFPIRQLHIPGSGYWMSADGEQIQYRLFAHEANSPKVIKAYKEDPTTNFHKFVHGQVRVYAPDLTYRHQKDLNFATIFGAGLKKKALMLHFISQAQFRQLNEEQATWAHPWLATTLEVQRIYDRVLPEVSTLLQRASTRAEQHGFIRSLLGRRMTFPGGERLHKALNGRIQMSEADILKCKLIELHKHRKKTGFLLRICVHDEVDGDVPDGESARMVLQILNNQTFALRVPILWDGKIGKNWAECNIGKDEFNTAHRVREETIAALGDESIDSKKAVRDR